jgi:hypothetical protein
MKTSRDFLDRLTGLAAAASAASLKEVSQGEITDGLLP